MKYDVRDTAAGKSISAYVILKGNRQVATVSVHRGDGGRVIVNVWQRGEAAARTANAMRKAAGGKPLGDPITQTDKFNDAAEYQADAASGGGYDKFAAALAGMWIDGHVMGNHSSSKGAPRKPRGRSYYPSDAKAPRGYHFANHGHYDRETGQRRDSFYYRDAAEKAAGEGASWEAREAIRKDLESADAGKLESGYSDCYRSAGLRFLEERGYTVIQAL